jgi:4-amino-4-deoxy-L-arabinose transferase-like glycosyltransferase
MWTSASISAYQMFFEGWQRENLEPDSWYITYALKNGVDTSKISAKQMQWYDKSNWTFGWKAPNLGKFIMGKYLSVAYGDELKKGGYFEFTSPDGQPSNVPYSYAPQEMIAKARIPNAIFNALTLMLVFLMAWLFVDFWVGLIASALLMTNKVFMLVNTAVGLDSFSTFFLTLSLFTFLMGIKTLFENKKTYIPILWAVATGFSFGFALSSKLNSALFAYTAAYTAVVVLIQLLRKMKPFAQFRTQMLLLISSAAIVLVLSYGIFLYLNPQIQGEVSKNITTLQESVDEFFTRRANANKTRDIKEKFDVSLQLVIDRNFVVKDPEIYYGTFGRLIPFKGNPIDGILIVSGFLVLLLMSFRELKNAKSAPLKLGILLMTVVVFYGNTDFIWIDYSRYHTPFYPYFSILSALALVSLFGFVKTRMAKKKSV